VFLHAKNQQTEKTFSKPHFGAFSTAPKTGLYGLRIAASGYPASAPACPQAPQGVAPPSGWHNPHDRHMVTDFELIFFEEKHYTGAAKKSDS
jgi:hypothetical protein